MLFEFLDKLRKKPIHVRQRITVFVSIGITVFIFSLWWSSFDARDAMSRGKVAENALSPTDALSETLQSGKDLLANSLLGLQKLLEMESATSSPRANALNEDVAYSQDRSKAEEQYDNALGIHAEDERHPTQNAVAPEHTLSP